MIARLARYGILLLLPLATAPAPAAVNDFALPSPIGLQLGACTLDSSPRTARELSRRREGAAVGHQAEMAPMGSDGLRWASMGFEVLGRILGLVHRHIPVAPSVMSMTGGISAM